MKRELKFSVRIEDMDAYITATNGVDYSETYKVSVLGKLFTMGLKSVRASMRDRYQMVHHTLGVGEK